jgi:hypothetical protein
MRGKLDNKSMVWASYRKSRVRFKPRDERVASVPPPALLLTKCSFTDRRLSMGERHFDAFKSAKIICSLRKIWCRCFLGTHLPVLPQRNKVPLT